MFCGAVLLWHLLFRGVGLALSQMSQFKECIRYGFFASCRVLVPSVGFMLQIAMAFLRVRRLLWFVCCPPHWHVSPSKLRSLWTAALESNNVLFWLGQWKENQGLTALWETPHMDSSCSKVFRKIKHSFPRINSQVWNNNNWSIVWMFLRLLIILLSYSPEILYQFILMSVEYETDFLLKHYYF